MSDMFDFISKSKRLIRRFLRASEGIAAVEFALILPLLLLLYLGTVEGSRAISVDRRLTSIASAMGDLVAQTSGGLTLTELNDYFEIAGIIIAPYPTNNLKQVITSVYVDADGAATVDWSYPYNSGTAHVTGAAYTLPSQFTDIARDTYVIVSEVELNYQPLTDFIYANGFRLYKELFHVPRFGTHIAVDPDA